MPQIDLANIKTRLLGFGAVMKDVVQKAGVSLRDIETAISDNLWEDLYGDE